MCLLAQRPIRVSSHPDASLARTWTAKLSATAIDVVAGTTGCVPEKRNLLDVSFALSSLTLGFDHAFDRR